MEWVGKQGLSVFTSGASVGIYTVQNTGRLLQPVFWISTVHDVMDTI